VCEQGNDSAGNATLLFLTCVPLQVCGGDLAGTIEFVHAKSKWKLGDRVVAVTTGWRWEDVKYGMPTHLQMQDRGH
jgi:hypothetical protein